MPYRSDEDDEKKTEETSASRNQSSQLLTLFNFYWLKFLSQKRVIDQERKLLEDEIAQMETEAKISSTRDAINDLSSS